MSAPESTKQPDGFTVRWSDRILRWMIPSPTFWISDVEIHQRDGGCSVVLKCKRDRRRKHSRSALVTIDEAGYRFQSTRGKGAIRLERVDSVTVEKEAENCYRLHFRATDAVPGRDFGRVYLIESAERLLQVQDAIKRVDGWSEKLTVAGTEN